MTHNPYYLRHFKIWHILKVNNKGDIIIGGRGTDLQITTATSANKSPFNNQFLFGDGSGWGVSFQSGIDKTADTTSIAANTGPYHVNKKVIIYDNGNLSADGKLDMGGNLSLGGNLFMPNGNIIMNNSTCIRPDGSGSIYITEYKNGQCSDPKLSINRFENVGDEYKINL
jgi:hypothetical protein